MRRCRYWLHYGMDARVLATLIAVSAGTVLVFGLIPAVHAARTDLNEALKAGTTLRQGRTARWLTNGFLMVQFGLTVVLLSYAVVDLFDRPLRLPSDATIGTPSLVSASVTLPTERYGGATERAAFYRAAHNRFATVPGVTATTFTDVVPLRGGQQRAVEIETLPAPDGVERHALTIAVARDYFRVLDVPLVAGRDLNDRDSVAGQRAAVVNEQFAIDHFGTTSRIGRRIKLLVQDAAAAPSEWLTVVGVSATVRQRAGNDADPVVYLPFDREPPATASLLFRTSGAHRAAVDGLRDALRQLDPNVPLYQVLTMPQVMEQVTWVRLMSVRLMRILTVAALLLATAGLYGVTAHHVGQRAREIGIRLALGATTSHVRAVVLRRVGWQIGASLAVGVVFTMFWDASFATGDLDLRVVSPSVLGPIAAIMVLIAAVACVVPVRRATRVEPVVILRSEF